MDWLALGTALGGVAVGVIGAVLGRRLKAPAPPGKTAFDEADRKATGPSSHA